VVYLFDAVEDMSLNPIKLRHKYGRQESSYFFIHNGNQYVDNWIPSFQMLEIIWNLDDYFGPTTGLQGQIISSQVLYTLLFSLFYIALEGKNL
jgi:hypothetical protein